MMLDAARIQAMLLVVGCFLDILSMNIDMRILVLRSTVIV